MWAKFSLKEPLAEKQNNRRVATGESKSKKKVFDHTKAESGGVSAVAKQKRFSVFFIKS